MIYPDILIVEDDASKRVFDGASCAFGVFDGVHRGHRFLIDCAKEDARENDCMSVAITFSIDPDEMFGGPEFVKLMSNEQRLSALAETGIDVVAVLPFDKPFAALSPSGFLNATFGANPPRCLHVGDGFRFGCRGSGDVGTLERWGLSRGMAVRCHALLRHGGTTVSSTRIRRLLAEGRIAEAEDLLGRSV